MNVLHYLYGLITYFPILLIVVSAVSIISMFLIFYFLHRGQSIKSRLTGFNLIKYMFLSFWVTSALFVIPVIYYGVSIEGASNVYVKSEAGRENPIIKLENNFKDKNIQWTIFTGDADDKNEYTDKKFFKVLTTDDKTKKVISVSESSRTIEELNEYLDSTLGKPLK